MPNAEAAAHTEDAFERIEETILPCIAMMLETLVDATAAVPGDDRRDLAAELAILAAELEALTQSIERSGPYRISPGGYRTKAA